jgi:hypothetical protein
MPQNFFDPKYRAYVSGENNVPLYVGNPWIFQPLLPESHTASTKNGQKYMGQVRLPYDLSADRVCIVAGVGGQYVVVEDRLLDPFSITGSLVNILSPEYDMKSQIEFRFSHDIYKDRGVLYSPEYISHRTDAKIDFLKSLQISPHIELTPDDVILTPDRAILTLNLEEAKKYTITLQDIADIYGRKASVSFSETIQSEPFLSLKLTEPKSIYAPDEPIQAKLYALLSPKNTYTLKLCRTNLESFSRVEKILTDSQYAKSETIASMINSSDFFECRAKDIVVSSNGYISPFLVDEFFP